MSAALECTGDGCLLGETARQPALPGNHLVRHMKLDLFDHFRPVGGFEEGFAAPWVSWINL